MRILFPLTYLLPLQLPPVRQALAALRRTAQRLTAAPSTADAALNQPNNIATLQTVLSRSFDDGTAEGEAAAAQFERLSRAVSTIIAVEYHGRAAELQARYERLDPRGVHAQRNFRRETAERTAATERGETPPPPPQRSAAQAAEAAAFSAALHTTMREASRSASLRPFWTCLELPPVPDLGRVPAQLRARRGAHQGLLLRPRSLLERAATARHVPDASPARPAGDEAIWNVPVADVMGLRSTRPGHAA